MYHKIPINTNISRMSTSEIIKINNSSINSTLLIVGGIILGITLIASVIYIYNSNLRYDKKK